MIPGQPQGARARSPPLESPSQPWPSCYSEREGSATEASPAEAVRHAGERILPSVTARFSLSARPLWRPGVPRRHAPIMSSDSNSSPPPLSAESLGSLTNSCLSTSRSQAGKWRTWTCGNSPPAPEPCPARNGGWSSGGRSEILRRRTSRAGKTLTYSSPAPGNG